MHRRVRGFFSGGVPATTTFGIRNAFSYFIFLRTDNVWENVRTEKTNQRLIEAFFLGGVVHFQSSQLSLSLSLSL